MYQGGFMSNQAFRHYNVDSYRQHLDHHEQVKDALDFVREAVGRKYLESILDDELRLLNE
jgi:hypothetical protein